jgi:hypothetical protein
MKSSVVASAIGGNLTTTIERIQAEISKIPEEHLGESYGLIREFAAAGTSSPGTFGDAGCRH